MDDDEIMRQAAKTSPRLAELYARSTGMIPVEDLAEAIAADMGMDPAEVLRNIDAGEPPFDVFRVVDVRDN